MRILLEASLTFQSLYDIRELNKMKNIKNDLVKNLMAKYSYNFVRTLLEMREVNDYLRLNFMELDNNII